MSHSRGSAFFESLQIFCLVSLDNPWKHWWEVEGGGGEGNRVEGVFGAAAPCAGGIQAGG